MSDKLKSQLDAIFATHEAIKKKIEQAKSEREQREDAFVQDFYSIQESLIRPTFAAVGEHVKAKGYDFRIEATRESTDHQGRYEAPRISIRFLLADRPGNYREHEYPHFSAIAEKSSQKVRFRESTIAPGRGGHSGGVGDATIAGVTADLLQSHLVKLLREVFK